jgi:uncharacterized Zn-finger protein
MSALKNFPFTVIGDEWCCGMPGCTYRKPREKKSLITYHKNTHFPHHICETCGSAFPQKKMLETHIAIKHTDERPYVCNHCNKGFHQLSNLNDHILKNHSPAAEPQLRIEIPPLPTETLLQSTPTPQPRPFLQRLRAQKEQETLLAH